MKVLSAVLLLVLALLSVCRAAPLTCDQLLTNQNHGSEVTGTWYYVAASINSCFFSKFMHVLNASIAFDISSTGNPNQYEVKTKIKFLSLCLNDTEVYFYDNVATMTDSRQKKSYILPSSCSDCLVLKENNVLLLLSRKPSVDAADLRELETQAKCAGFPRPRLLNTDHDFATCKPLENSELTEEEQAVLKKRFGKFIPEIVTCIEEGVAAFATMFQNYLPEPVKTTWAWVKSLMW